MKKVFQENSQELEYHLYENRNNEWNSFSKPLAIDGTYSPLSSIGELIPELEEMTFD